MNSKTKIGLTQTIAIGDLGVCQSVTRAGCAKTAERIDVLFWVETPRDPRNDVLDEGPPSPPPPS